MAADDFYVEPKVVDSLQPGTVYALTNEAMPGLVKIGMTTRDIVVRMRELSNWAGVPLPFTCIAAVRVEHVSVVEANLHRVFAVARLSQTREFFRVSTESVAAAMRLVAGVVVTPPGDVVDTVEDQRALDKERQRRANLDMTAIGVFPGAILTSRFDEKTTCVVLDARRVLFEEQNMSLSGAAVLVGQRNGYRSTSLAGSEYWLHEGKSLNDIRNEQLAGFVEAAGDTTG